MDDLGGFPLIFGNTHIQIPSLKLTVRTWKWMVGILLSYWDGLFSGANLLLVSGSVSSGEASENSPKLAVLASTLLHEPGCSSTPWSLGMGNLQPLMTGILISWGPIPTPTDLGWVSFIPYGNVMGVEFRPHRTHNLSQKKTALRIQSISSSHHRFPPLKLTVRTCQEAGNPKGKSSSNHTGFVSGRGNLWNKHLAKMVVPISYRKAAIKGPAVRSFLGFQLVGIRYPQYLQPKNPPSTSASELLHSRKWTNVPQKGTILKGNESSEPTINFQGIC